MCGIQMYYEVGVVKKFQVPQEVSIHGNYQCSSIFLLLISEYEEIYDIKEKIFYCQNSNIAV